MNVITGNLEAVYFEGRGPTKMLRTSGFLHQRLTDAEGNVLYTHPPNPVGIPPDLLDPSQRNLPEHSFGDYDTWDLD